MHRSPPGVWCARGPPALPRRRGCATAWPFWVSTSLAEIPREKSSCGSAPVRTPREFSIYPPASPLPSSSGRERRAAYRNRSNCATVRLARGDSGNPRMTRLVFNAPSLRVLSAVLAIHVGAVALPAQQPSFAGRWAVAPDSTASGGGTVPTTGSPGSGWGTPLTITQNSTRLTVEYPFFSRYDMQPPLQFTFALDGSETRNAVMLGNGVQEQISRAAWNGATLVITTVHVVANPSGAGDSVRVEVTRRLSLESPTRLIAETTRAGVLGGLPSTTRTVYTKQ